MKYLFLLLLAPLALRAQHPLTGGGYFTLNVRADGYKGRQLNYGLSTYMGYFTDSLPMDVRGRWSGRIPLQGEVQDFAFRFPDDSYNFYVQAGDTIDVAQGEKGIDIRNRNPAHDAGLKAALAVRRQMDAEYSEVMTAIMDRKSSDTARFEKIKSFFTLLMDTLDAQPVDSFARAKLGADIYYNCQEAMMMGMLLPQFHLTMPGRDYRVQSEADFHHSDTYRWFLFNYLRVGVDKLNGYKLEDTGEEREGKITGFSPPLNDYYSGLLNLKVTEMRDWFITRSIVTDFESYDYNDAVKVYEDYLPKMRIQDYKDTLQRFYLTAQRLKPGAPAPAFTLSDEHGRPVSLADFRGKVVVIDFWGVGCGPCIYDIQKTLPAIHQTYKDKKVVFLNICVDVDEAEWKKSLATTPVDGVNVLASGWTRNPVCQTYGVESIPHYFVIGADGAVIHNNGYSSSLKDQIDAALDKTAR